MSRLGSLSCRNSIESRILLPISFSGHFIIPSSACLSRSQLSAFSTTPRQPFPRDRNRSRGVSALRRTGPRQPLSVSKDPLPQPVLDPKKKTKIPVDEDHGLWQFFDKERKAISTPTEDHAHGRPWTVEELRNKSWDDLHSLWWVCAKERNRLATSAFERERLKAGYGEYESDRRDSTVRRTQRAIKHVLTERYYAWEEAWELGKTEPGVNMFGEGSAFDTQDLEEEQKLVEENSPSVRVHSGTV
ncbi:MAG: hypothetical protein M1825_001406 [Sarcosagium campestre]|nr:MAG: hypothetical protein M1825_001406 [Sarcosagium campestre]